MTSYTEILNLSKTRTLGNKVRIAFPTQLEAIELGVYNLLDRGLEGGKYAKGIRPDIDILERAAASDLDAQAVLDGEQVKTKSYPAI